MDPRLPLCSFVFDRTSAECPQVGRLQTGSFQTRFYIKQPLPVSMRRASKRYPDTHVLSSPRELSKPRSRHCEERSDAAIQSGQSTAGRRGLTPLPRKGDSFVRGLPRRLRRSQ